MAQDILVNCIAISGTAWAIVTGRRDLDEWNVGMRQRAPQNLCEQYQSNTQDPQHLPPRHPFVKHKADAGNDRYHANCSNDDQKRRDIYPVDQRLCGSDYVYFEQPGLGRDDSPEIGQDSDSEFG